MKLYYTTLIQSNLSNMSDTGEGNGRKRRRTVTEDEGMDTDEEAVLLGEEGDEEEVKDKREEIEEVVEVVEKVEKRKGIKVDKEIEKIREEGDKSKGAGKNKRRICKRSDEAIKRRRVISEAKLKAKHQARKDGKSLPSGKPDDKCGGKALPPPIKGKGKAKNSKPLLRKTFRVDPRPTPRQDYVVAINIDGRPAIEEDRRAQMAALAFAMAVQQSSSTQPPIYLRDSRVENGTILLWCDSAASQESILSMLSNQDGITLTPRGGSRRLVFGVPGYMANLPGEMVLHLLERQNPELPQGSLQYVSLHNGPHPTIFVDADERAQEYLEDHDFRLETLTTDLRLRPAAEGKPPPK